MPTDTRSGLAAVADHLVGHPHDPRQAFARLMHPAVVQLFGALPPMHGRRCLASVIHRLAEELVPAEARSSRDELLAANAALLGAPVHTPGARRRLARRHLWLEALRRADDWLLAFGDLARVVPDLLVPSCCEGLEHATALAQRGGPVVVAGAHVGPMSHYVPCLAYHLAQAGHRPRVIAVVNGPEIPGQRARLAQLERHAGITFEPALKDPARPLALLRRLRAALAEGAWVLTQVDALSAGATTTPLACSGQRLVLPGAWGAARLAQRFGAATLPVRATRDRLGVPRLHIEPPLLPTGATPPRPAGGERLGRRAAAAPRAAALAARLGSWIRQDPADWSLLPRLRLMLASR